MNLNADQLQQLRTARARGQDLLDAWAAGQDRRSAAASLAAALHQRYLDSEGLAAMQPQFERLPLVRAQQCRALLALDAQGQCWAVRADPLDGELDRRLSFWAQAPLRWALATAEDLHAYLNQREEATQAISQLLQHPEDGADQGPALEALTLASATESTSPAVRLLNSTLFDALRAGASDVHLEAVPEGLVVKLRVDGLLDEVARLPNPALAEQAISRLKVLAQLDIAEQRVPQDGSFRVAARGREIDLRVSVMPSVHGEDAVIRILDKQAMVEAQGRLSLEGLGFDADHLGALRRLLRAAHGMVLVTGPTGSGKTTTLYAALTEMHTGREKLITIEDPVEYQLPGVLQIPVNDRKGLSFARGLRSILRHDPDIIMVGEIRDPETAEIAVQSALTGHLVLSTVHASSVFDVFGRFTHMGLDPYALGSALNGVWSQRLVRLNCPHCSRPAAPDPTTLEWLGLGADALQGAELRRGSGCGDCRGTGYRGRRAIAEVLMLNDEMRELIVLKAPIREMKRLAAHNGGSSLLEAGLALVRQGQTTLEEVCRVALGA